MDGDDGVVAPVVRLAGALLPRAATELASFLRSPQFKVYLDETCVRPHDWKALWKEPPINENADPKHAAQDRQWWWMKYGAAGFIPRMLSYTSAVTSDWRVADAAVVVHFAHHATGMPTITMRQCLERLRRESVSFRETGGARHFFVLTGDNGPCCIDGRYKNVDFLNHHVIGNHGQTGVDHQLERWGVAPPIPCFDPRKDISIPTPSVHFPAVPRAVVQPPAEASAPAKRPLLLLHAGEHKYSACRRKLLALFEHSSDPEVRVARALPRNESAALMLRARFCPICSGFSPWTQRLPEAMNAGCVPIVVEERWRLPFEGVLDYSAFSGSLPLARLSELPQYARSLNHPRLYGHVLAAREAMRYELGAAASATGHGMLPLLLFEMWRRLNQPIPIVFGDSGFVRVVRSSLNENAPGGSRDAVMGRPTKYFDDTLLQLNESHAFLNETRFRCWTHGYTCECARADLHAMNRKMKWPPKPDRLAGTVVRAAQARWLEEHAPWAVAPG